MTERSHFGILLNNKPTFSQSGFAGIADPWAAQNFRYGQQESRSD